MNKGGVGGARPDYTKHIRATSKLVWPEWGISSQKTELETIRTERGFLDCLAQSHFTDEEREAQRS